MTNCKEAIIQHETIWSVSTTVSLLLRCLLYMYKYIFNIDINLLLVLTIQKDHVAGLFNYVIAFINFSTIRIYYMEKWQEDFRAILYTTAGSSFQMHSQYPTFIFKLVLHDKTFSLNFQSLVYYIQLLLLATNIIKKFE